MDVNFGPDAEEMRHRRPSQQALPFAPLPHQQPLQVFEPVDPEGYMPHGLSREKLPLWWLFVLGSWSPPQQIFWNLIQSIIVPAQVAFLVGDARKQVALGYVATATQLGACWGPCIGAWSDRCDSRLFGRRRPFMVAGSVTFCGALFVMQRAQILEVFAFGNFLFCFTAAICCAPFNAILPELVPPQQRSTAAAIQTWLSTIGSQVAAGLGVLVGQKVLSFDTVYYTGMAVNLFLVAPLGQFPFLNSPNSRAQAEPVDSPAPPRRSGGGWGAPRLLYCRGPTGGGPSRCRPPRPALPPPLGLVSHTLLRRPPPPAILLAFGGRRAANALG